MTVFQGTSFNPTTISIMTQALQAAVDRLPEPISSRHVQALARNVVDLARQGERDPERMMLLALLALRMRQ